MERVVNIAEACLCFEELMREAAERHETIIRVDSQLIVFVVSFLQVC